MPERIIHKIQFSHKDVWIVYSLDALAQ